MVNTQGTEIAETKQCLGCEETDPEKFSRYPNGKLVARCKVCICEYQRQWRAERRKPRIISQENTTFFHLGTTAKDDQIRDLEKVINIQEKTIRALVEVIKEADIRDAKRIRIPA